MTKKLKITQIKSTIGRPAVQGRIVRSLGIKRTAGFGRITPSRVGMAIRTLFLQNQVDRPQRMDSRAGRSDDQHVGMSTLDRRMSFG